MLRYIMGDGSVAKIGALASMGAVLCSGSHRIACRIGDPDLTAGVALTHNAAAGRRPPVDSARADCCR